MADKGQVLANVFGAMVGDPPTVEQANTFQTTSDSTLGFILTLLADNLYDLYMDYTNSTELWDGVQICCL